MSTGAARLMHEWRTSLDVPKALRPSELGFSESERVALERVIRRVYLTKGALIRRMLLRAELKGSFAQVVTRYISACKIAGDTAESIGNGIAVLRRILEAGKRAGHFAAHEQVCVVHYTAPHLFALDALEAAQDIETIDALAREQIYAEAALSEEETAGRLVYTAVVYQGLVHVPSLVAVLESLGGPILASASWHYSDYFHEDRVRSVMWARRTLYRDLFTVLAIQDGSALAPLLTAPDRRAVTKNLHGALAAYLRRIGCDEKLLPKSLHTFAATAGKFLITRLPPYIAAYLSGAIPASSPPEEDLRRELGLRPQRATPKSPPRAAPADDEAEDKPHAENWQPLGELPAMEAALRGCLVSTDESEIDARLGVLASTASASAQTGGTEAAREPLPGLRLVAEWGRNLLKTDGLGPRGRRYPAICRALGTLGPKAALALSDWDDDQVDAPTLEELAHELRGAVIALPERSLLLRDIDRLCTYLGSRTGIEFTERATVPDAALFSMATIGTYADILAGHTSPLPSGFPPDMASGLIVGQMFGVRTGELHGLPTAAAVQGAMIRKVFKTAWSRRNLPLEVLPPQFLEAWQRLVREALSSGRTWLFSEDGSEIVSAERLLRAARSALREATENEHSRLYHVRHSTASSITLGVAHSVHDLSALRGRIGNLEDSLNNGDRFRSAVLGSDIAQTFLFAIAIAFGHSRPGVTCQHYIHVFDLIAFALLEKHVLPCPPDLILAAARLPATSAGRMKCTPPHEVVQAVEKRNPSRVLRDDTPAAPKKPPENVFKILAELHSMMAALPDGEIPSDLSEAVGCANALGRRLTAKVGSRVRQHPMHQTAAGHFVPFDLGDREARREARAICRMLESLILKSSAECRWALDRYVEGAMANGRVSFDALEDAQRFLRFLAAGGNKKIPWGQGSFRRRGDLLQLTSLPQGGGRLWVSLGAKTGPRHSLVGMRWTWQMMHIGWRQLPGTSPEATD